MSKMTPRSFATQACSRTFPSESSMPLPPGLYRKRVRQNIAGSKRVKALGDGYARAA